MISENKKFVILDYGVGNVHSLYNAFSKFCNVTISRDKDVLRDAHCIIFPGVGTFKAAMESIYENDLYDLLQELKYDKNFKYFFGVCLGMQIMFEASEESPGVKGLGFLKGKCKKLSNKKEKTPNIGWKDVIWSWEESGYRHNGEAYFCHSFGIKDKESQNYYKEFFYHGDTIYVAAIEHENIQAYQFHPEKSGKYGLKLIENFVKFVNGVKTR